MLLGYEILKKTNIFCFLQTMTIGCPYCYPFLVNYRVLNPFLANVPILYPLERPENQRFSVF